LTPEHLRWIAFGIGLVTIALQYNKVEFVGAFTIVLWIIMMITVVVTVVVGVSHFQASNAFTFPKNWFSFSWGFILGLGSASMIAIYDLMGYYNVCYLEEEVKNPGYVFPRAILWSVVAITGVYAVMNLIILGVMPWQEIAASNHIVVDIVQKFHGTQAAGIMSILIVLTAYGSVYSLMTSYSRLPFAAARDGFFFSGLAAVHPTRHFPHYSLLLVGAMTALASLFTLEFIIAVAVSSRILIQFLGQIVGLTLLRKTQPDRPRPFSMWLYPIPSCIAFIGFLFVFISSGIAAVAWGLAWIGVGVILFFGWARKNREWPFAVPVETTTP
jgi:amino acid transporter